ncbi:MAG: VRR-NUC domain-containing protein [Candidatus Altiarchaeota archaeon]|nr:VRR-NUC domain-containing protein [Candidatus Altiarchaeota archaeon]
MQQKKLNPNRSPLEHDEQVKVFQWASYYPALRYMYAVPNGGERNIKVAKRLKDEGVKSGVPDLCLPIARNGHHGLYIEMKRLRGSSTSADQKEYHEYLIGQGYAVKVCKGHEAAINTIKEYMGM